LTFTLDGKVIFKAKVSGKDAFWTICFGDDQLAYAYENAQDIKQLCRSR
jgi:hypothetical protein